MFIYVSNCVFKKILDFKRRIDKKNKRILFYDLLDYLAYIATNDKKKLNNYYGVLVGKYNYAYTLRRYGISNINQIDENFIKIRFRNLFTVIPESEIKEILTYWVQQEWENIIIGGKDFALIQRRFIGTRLTQVNFLCYLLKSLQLWFKMWEQEAMKKIYEFERNEKKIYYVYTINKIWKRYKIKIINNCKINILS